MPGQSTVSSTDYLLHPLNDLDTVFSVSEVPVHNCRKGNEIPAASSSAHTIWSSLASVSGSGREAVQVSAVYW